MRIFVKNNKITIECWDAEDVSRIETSEFHVWNHFRPTREDEDNNGCVEVWWVEIPITERIFIK